VTPTERWVVKPLTLKFMPFGNCGGTGGNTPASMVYCSPTAAVADSVGRYPDSACGTPSSL
jgi:hypothetical protein